MERLATEHESEPLRALAGLLLEVRAMLAVGATPKLEDQIDRAVAGMLARGGRNDKGEYLVGAKEIDAAVKWVAVKQKITPPDESGYGSALGRD